MPDQKVEFSSVNEELREAYGATNFNVLGPPSFTLRIGVESPDIANLYQGHIYSFEFERTGSRLGEMTHHGAHAEST